MKPILHKYLDEFISLQFDLETFDTTLYLLISFQNAKYTKIVDIKSNESPNKTL
jgi:hypothetical protein